jgi:hypothetical protein
MPVVAFCAAAGIASATAASKSSKSIHPKFRFIIVISPLQAATVATSGTGSNMHRCKLSSIFMCLNRETQENRAGLCDGRQTCNERVGPEMFV